MSTTDLRAPCVSPFFRARALVRGFRRCPGRAVAALLIGTACQTADVAGGPECRAAYERAHRAADSAVVDRRPTGAHASVTCGALRAAGTLAQDR